MINGTLVLYATVNQMIQIQFIADDENGDEVKFNLTDEVPGAFVDGNTIPLHQKKKKKKKKKKDRSLHLNILLYIIDYEIYLMFYIL